MKKKSILFEIDILHWAFYYLTKSWVIELQNEYDFYFVCNDQYRIEKLNGKTKAYFYLYNLVSSIKYLFLKTFFSENRKIYFIHPSLNYKYPKHTRPFVYEFKGNEVKRTEINHFDYQFSMAYFFQYIAKHPFTANKNIVGIFNDCYPHLGPEYDFTDHTEVNALSREEFYKKYIQKFDYLLVANKNLIEAYAPLTKKCEYVLGIYKQEAFGKVRRKSEVFTLGWTGNPNREVKGFYEVIVPAVEIVKNTGRKINLKTSFSATYDEMIAFYEDVDLAVIASSGDGAPTMFCEASLCGIPSVSTKIGLPSMIIKHGENGLFINRDINEMAEAIIYLYDHPEVMKKFSERIKSDYLAVLDNKVQMLNFKKILNEC